MHSGYSEDFLINVNCKPINTEFPLLPSSSVPLCLTGAEDGLMALMAPSPMGRATHLFIELPSDQCHGDPVDDIPIGEQLVPAHGQPCCLGWQPCPQVQADGCQVVTLALLDLPSLLLLLGIQQPLVVTPTQLLQHWVSLWRNTELGERRYCTAHPAGSGHLVTAPGIFLSSYQELQCQPCVPWHCPLLSEATETLKPISVAFLPVHPGLYLHQCNLLFYLEPF